MRRIRTWLLCILVLCLLSGCALLEPSGRIASQGTQAQLSLGGPLGAQLGLLEDKLSRKELQACAEIWESLWPLRQSRVERDQWAPGDYENRLTMRLRALLDDYTVKYLDGDVDGFGYENPPVREIAQFSVIDGETLHLKDTIQGAWTESELTALWDTLCSILPEGAFQAFGRFDLISDGPNELLAYVYAMDAAGERWVLAVDPEDVGDSDSFVETVLHEYFHYITLNDTQVAYHQKKPSGETYAETGMSSLPGSYIDDFYQAYWPHYIDDCLAGSDNYNFFLRHYDDFVDAYAATDPSEDICESFAFFVLYDRREPVDVWEQKLDFFYRYPELVALRGQIRQNLALDAAA